MSLRNDLHFGTEGAHGLKLLGGKGIGADDPQRVALDGTHKGQRTPGRTAGVFDNGLPGLEFASGLRGFDHRQCHAVLVRAGWVGGFELDPDFGRTIGRKPFETNDRRVADGCKS